MITFDHVTYTYEGQTVPSLRDCSFTVGPGELILFTGELIVFLLISFFFVS